MRTSFVIELLIEIDRTYGQFRFRLGTALNVLTLST
jgi:hypothetical protein